MNKEIAEIRASDLRLGNLVQSNGYLFFVSKIYTNELGGIVKEIIDHKNKSDSDFYMDYVSAFIENVKPIPLTEEWLEKFGLIKKYLENPFEDGGYDLDEKGNRWYYWVDDGTFNLQIQPNGEIWFEIYSCYRHIKYVHELQNLYFALSGKELNTK